MFSAKTVLDQLTQSNNGTDRLSIMIGAKNFVQNKEDYSVSFKYPRGKYVKIKLNGLDLYDITFGSIRKYQYKVLNEVKNVYAEDLKSVFENYTKLYLSL